MSAETVKVSRITRANLVKSCPFCGSEEINSVDIYTGDSHYPFKHAVRCSQCQCGTYFYSLFGDAVEAWNRRA